MITKKRETTPKPLKKALNNDGIQVKRNLNSDAESVESSNKRGLRDQRKIKTSHLEARYADFEALPATSSKVFKQNEGVKKCLNLLNKLRRHQSAGPFLEPVDAEGLGLKDYHTIITEPMDISTVETKLRNGEYTTVNEFAADVRKIWNNAFTYNPKGSVIFHMTAAMSTYFEKLFKEIENVTLNETIRHLEKKIEKMSRKINEYTGVSRPPTSGSKSYRGGNDKPMTTQEKKILGEKIRALPADCLRGVWDIVSQGNSYQQNNEILEFDIDSLLPRVARDLERYVNAKLNALAKSKKGKQNQWMVPISAEPTRESGFSDMGYGDAYDQPETNPTLSNYNSKVDQAGIQNNDDAESHSSESSFLSE